MDEQVIQIDTYRHSLVAYLYRLTGSVEEAEDLAQESMIKYVCSQKDEIKNPKAWLFKVATNLAWDFLKSAKHRHESYKGQWLPEPYVEENYLIEDELELDESLSMALFVLMEKLSIKERIVYILYDVFDFSHDEVSKVIESSISNSRQLLSRAKKKLNVKKSNYLPTKEEHSALTYAFLDAVKKGDLNQLEALFSKNLIFMSDGGGKAKSAQKVIRGSRAIVKFLLKITSKNFLEKENNLSIEMCWFNGSLGFLIFHYEMMITSFHIEIEKGKIVGIYVLRNPDKLKFFKNLENENENRNKFE